MNVPLTEPPADAGPSDHTLASRINEHHELAFRKAREALEHARRAGILLLEAKAKVKHGQWLPWLEANIRFSARTAQGYIRLADNWEKLQAKCATVSHLTLRDALHALADPFVELELLGDDLSGDPKLSGEPELLDDPRYYSLNLKDRDELSTPLADGRLVVISPSTHEGFWFVGVVDDKMCEGCRRPIRGVYVSVALDVFGVPPKNLWTRTKGVERRAHPIWMNHPTEDDWGKGMVSEGLQPFPSAPLSIGEA